MARATHKFPHFHGINSLDQIYCARLGCGTARCPADRTKRTLRAIKRRKRPRLSSTRTAERRRSRLFRDRPALRPGSTYLPCERAIPFRLRWVTVAAAARPASSIVRAMSAAGGENSARATSLPAGPGRALRAKASRLHAARSRTAALIATRTAAARRARAWPLPHPPPPAARQLPCRRRRLPLQRVQRMHQVPGAPPGH
jgi:hypothetical protein